VGPSLVACFKSLDYVNVVGMSQAPAAGMVRLWTSVSAAHGVLERRRRYFLTTLVEDRLGEQLSLIPVLQTWMPMATVEVDDLVSLLQAYVGDELEAGSETAAMQAVAYVRTMAANRARTYRPVEDDAL
jgi:hypothetical protein